MRPLQFFIVLLFLVSCKTKSVDKKQNIGIIIPKTKLKESTDSLLATFKGNSPNAVLAASHWVDLDSLRSLIYNVGLLDINDYDEYNVSSKNCNGIDETSWNSKSNENVLKRIVRQSFELKYIDTLLGNHNTLLISDYEIYRRSKPFYIMLRICDSNMFEKLIVDSVSYIPEKYEKIVNHIIYKPYFSEELLGLQETQEMFDFKKKACR